MSNDMYRTRNNRRAGQATAPPQVPAAPQRDPAVSLRDSAVPPQDPAVPLQDPTVPLWDSIPVPSTSPTGRVPHTRTGAVWFGICAGTLLSVVLIVFMLQNTRSVEVSFLWLHGALPLALALLIAGVGTAILTMVVGTARITQLRRLTRRQRH